MDIPPRGPIVACMANDSDIIIVGGGLNGPALALALAQAGFGVTVIDALPRGTRDHPGFDGRSYALALSSVRLLRGIGIWPRIAAEAQPIQTIVISDGRPGEGAGPFTLTFDSAEIEEGAMGHMVEDRFLRRAFLEAMDRTGGIVVFDSARVLAQESGPGHATVTLDDGRRITGALVVGCDGRSSGSAARAGIGRQGHGYGQTAVTCAVAHERPHHGTAHELFLPAGPFAILPLPGNRSSIVWSESTARAADLMAMDDAAFLEALRPVFGSHLGAIRLEGVRFSYPLNLTLAESFVAPRLALVGDAAHGLHPIAGQGLNAGLRDVAALADVLGAARRRGEDPGSDPVLERYARWRRVDTATLAAATDGLNRLFSNDDPFLRLARGLGLAAVQNMGLLRRAFIREAAGLTGDLPALMR
ncbi:MAG: UbiH/UbiF/VisC/COQ6 family ubiquinone biosynthesis hydroxylase [Rubellimicrobium sp.]|nr:UbiH/UbiF/VisC/COQ6 family ubiquinone biosynthesis hydroxylase [Rubellimicrobium sp.]